MMLLDTRALWNLRLPGLRRNGLGRWPSARTGKRRVVFSLVLKRPYWNLLERYTCSILVVRCANTNHFLCCGCLMIFVDRNCVVAGVIELCTWLNSLPKAEFCGAPRFQSLLILPAVWVSHGGALCAAPAFDLYPECFLCSQAFAKPARWHNLCDAWIRAPWLSLIIFAGFGIFWMDLHWFGKDVCSIRFRGSDVQCKFVQNTPVFF